MRIFRFLLPILLLTATSLAATDVKIPFTLKTTDAAGAPITQNRFYFVYRPDNLPKNTSVPMVLVFECRDGDLPAKFYHRQADQAGFVLVSAAIEGNSTGNTVWVNGNPVTDGLEDIDYATAVIDRVTADENCSDTFITGISKGGHMTCCYACNRPHKIKAAADLDEFMGLTTNIPTAPVPMIFFQGTKDTNVPYAMVRDTVDAWRVKNRLLNITPITTFESSPLAPGSVTQATWPGKNPVAFVTIVGGSHIWPVPGTQTGFDVTDTSWAFFSQFLTSTQHAPRITSQPNHHTQYAGLPATFHVNATGDAPLKIQWQKNGQDIPHATATFYTTPPTTKADHAATFRAHITNAVGAFTSAQATLTVAPAPSGPVIITHPQDQTITAGKPVTFQVRTNESLASLKLQWQKNGISLLGASASDLTFIPTIYDSGATYRVLATSSAGTTTSSPVTLTVLPASGAPILLTNPMRSRIHPGETGTFSVTAQSATPMTWQWQKATFSTHFLDIPGATASTYTTPPAKLEDHRTLFRCIISNAAGPTPSAAEMLFVTPAN